MHIPKIILTLLGLILTVPSWTQGNLELLAIDSINRKSYNLRNTNPDSAMLLAREALAASENLAYERGKALALGRIAIALNNLNQVDSAISYFEMSLDVRMRNELSKSGVAGIYTRIGNIFKNKGLFGRAISYLERALDIRKELGQQRLISHVHSDLAIAYDDLAIRKLSVNDTLSAAEDLQQAIFHFESALAILKEEGLRLDYTKKAKMLSNVFLLQKDFSQALSYLNEAENICKSLSENADEEDSEDYLTIFADIYTRKGRLYNESGEAEKGTLFHQKAIEINREIDDPFSLFISLINMGDNALRLKKYQKALEYFKEAETLASIVESDKRQLLVLNNNLAETYENLGNDKLANEYLKKRYQLNTEISLESNQAQLEDATENLKLESDFTTTLLEKEYQEKLNIWIIIGSILLTGVLGLILYNSYQKQKYQEIIIENQEASHMQHLLAQLEEAEQQILADQSAKQQMLLTTIGKELHDSIGSMLSAAKRELENLRNNLSEIPNKAESQFEHSYGMIDKAIRDLRKISKSPDKLSLEEQLIPSLRELCKNINRIENSPHIELNTYRLEGVKLPAKHELHIFRIIQEAITNIIKHAQATDIQLQLDWADRILSITIEDNGIGFDPQKIKHGVGLDSMRSRTEELNGTFTLDTAPGKGSTLFMEISIPG